MADEDSKIFSMEQTKGGKEGLNAYLRNAKHDLVRSSSEVVTLHVVMGNGSL